VEDSRRPGKYQKLVQALSTPVADLHLSARPASALRLPNIRYVYELVQQSPTDLFRLPNFGNKSVREVQQKLATLGLTLGMTLDDDSYPVAVVATVAAGIRTTKGLYETRPYGVLSLPGAASVFLSHHVLKYLHAPHGK
jgi:hypothetical protein